MLILILYIAFRVLESTYNTSVILVHTLRMNPLCFSKKLRSQARGSRRGAPTGNNVNNLLFYPLWDFQNTVEPRYLELGYLEQLAISNRFPFPLVFL